MLTDEDRRRRVRRGSFDMQQPQRVAICWQLHHVNLTRTVSNKLQKNIYES